MISLIPNEHLVLFQSIAPLLFREQKGRGSDSSLSPTNQNSSAELSEKSLRCRSCGHVITSIDHRMSIDSSYKHTFFNPAGIVFKIGCFSHAPGCGVVGDASGEFSWFAGTKWTTVVCSGCFDHLGWLFEGKGDPFFGLILTSLIE